LALVAAAAVATTTALAASEAKRRPHVAVTKQDPVVVAGRYFAARERISVRLTVNGLPYAKRLRATRAGTFRATFAEADAQCQPFTVSARGATGSRATQTRTFNIPPPCGIAPQP
jgi:hypothetical protein